MKQLRPQRATSIRGAAAGYQSAVPASLRMVFIIFLAAVSSGRSARLHADPPPSVTDDVVAETPAEAEAKEADLRIRYALARLRLAELDLERALAANQQVKGAIGEREIARLRDHIRLLERQVEITREQPRTAARQATIAAAELALDTAVADLEAARRANQRVKGSVSGINIERLETRVELAEIRVELCRNPAYELSLLDEMQWNIDQLTDQMIDLRQRVEGRANNDFGQPD
ncbi:MAG: hypothetical protein O3C39_08955 [Planctomycetota bacterium]|nr:hypothetical protein [Planctomycetota bacterium]MDA1201798.1 hypothetical protein [Planctomycetota bacterium]